MDMKSTKHQETISKMTLEQKFRFLTGVDSNATYDVPELGIAPMYLAHAFRFPAMNMPPKQLPLFQTALEIKKQLQLHSLQGARLGQHGTALF